MQCESVNHSFLRLSSLTGELRVLCSIVLLMDTQIVFSLGKLLTKTIWTCYTILLVNICFHFIWINSTSFGVKLLSHGLDVCLWVRAQSLQSCPILCDPMDCSALGSSVHGDSPGKNTGVSCHALLQGIYPTQGSSPGLLHCRQILYRWATRKVQVYI